jgi:hypothetical protein
MKSLFKLDSKGNVLLAGGKPRGLTKATALDRSIQKWQFIVDHLDAGKDVQDDGATQTCALCSLYWEKHDCKGCPVLKVTGEEGCQGTPYEVWGNLACDESPSLRLSIAKSELNFLKALKGR